MGISHSYYDAEDISYDFSASESKSNMIYEVVNKTAVELDPLAMLNWMDISLLLLKGFIMFSVILTSILGNLLVIVSVAR